MSGIQKEWASTAPTKPRPWEPPDRLITDARIVRIAFVFELAMSGRHAELLASLDLLRASVDAAKDHAEARSDQQSEKEY
ncbi:hypothetical protein [Paraburkholderia tuberum]|nr:hypothetical protein [Paraburkholderia tuberum]